MPRKRKLKIGDLVRAYFLGTDDIYQVIMIIDKNTYKIKCVKSGTILPSVKWKKDMDKKSPWYIDDLVGHNPLPKSTEDQNTSQNTTDNSELEKAIKKQKKFISGKIKK
jgi:hypothetical protein